jgi:hypothetical protein
MTPLILSSFTIPAVTIFVLIALLIKKRDYIFPKKANTNVGANSNIEEDRHQADTRRKGYRFGKRYPDDFLDFSGGTMGI